MVDFETLTPGGWIGNGILDLYLSHQCLRLGDAHKITYVPQTFTHFTTQPNEEEIAQFALLNNAEHALDRSYIFAHWELGHWFLVLFNYGRRCSITFGRQYSNVTASYTKNENWERWHGPGLWARIGALAGIEQYDEQPSTASYQWKQVCFADQSIRCVL